MLQGPIVNPFNGKKPDSAIVFLHGYGASGDDLIDLSSAWREQLPQTIFLSPHAPEPCEINPFGYQWFGIKDFTPYDMRKGLDRTGPVLKNYLQGLSNTYNMPFDRIALVGFSQGTMMALEMLFHLPTLAGVLGFSGAFYPPIQPQNSSPQTPVMLVHGTLDTVVPFDALSTAAKQLGKFNVSVEQLSCPGLGHSIDQKGIEQGGHFLTTCFFQLPKVIHL